MKTVGELAEVIPGFTPKPAERRKTGKYLLLGGRNIQDGHLVARNEDSYINEIAKPSFQRAIARPGDLIVSTLFDRRKLLLYARDDPPAVVNNSCAIIRSDHASDYIVTYLRSLQGQEDFFAKASKATAGAFIARLSIANLAAIQIPILPISKLAKLGDARIEQSTTSELVRLKRELESKDAEITRLKATNAKLGTFYRNRIVAIESQIATNDLLNRIKHGETARLEFKSSLRWNVKRNAHGPEIENSVLKTIAAFCNTKGGELLIGVADNNAVVGVEHDGFPNNDKFMLHFQNLMTQRLTPCLADFVDYEMVNLDDKWVCHVRCKPSSEEVWLKANNNSLAQFFVRQGPSSTQLDGPDAVKYIRRRFDQ